MSYILILIIMIIIQYLLKNLKISRKIKLEKLYDLKLFRVFKCKDEMCTSFLSMTEKITAWFCIPTEFVSNSSFNEEHRRNIAIFEALLTPILSNVTDKIHVNRFKSVFFVGISLCPLYPKRLRFNFIFSSIIQEMTLDWRGMLTLHALRWWRESARVVCEWWKIA